MFARVLVSAGSRAGRSTIRAVAPGSGLVLRACASRAVTWIVGLPSRRRGDWLHLLAKQKVEEERYRFTSYRIATAPEPNSSRPTSFRSTIFDSPANKVGPRPTIRG
jgi:hypothetical protein